ncbi:MAG: ABC transporter permease [Acidobacteriota bacterium]|nr:MAG: ABC transporter permease [Acidobacteriota bacterium]
MPPAQRAAESAGEPQSVRSDPTPVGRAADPTRGRDAATPSPTIVRPERGWRLPDFREVWRYRELLAFLALRDIKIRYKQTLLGAAWAVLQPLLTMVIFSIFFGRLAKIPSDGVPYPVFAYTALLPWQLFAYSLTQASNSLVANERLVTKIYFPRLLIPLAAIVSSLVDFGIAFVVLLGMLALYGIVPGWGLLALPLLVLFAMTTSLAISLWLSALNVQYRDVRYVIPFLTQLWLFATPVAYPSSLLPESWRLVYALNPMAGVVEGFRWALLGTSSSAGPMILVSAAAVAVLLVAGLFYFRGAERHFADVV